MKATVIFQTNIDYILPQEELCVAASLASLTRQDEGVMTINQAARQSSIIHQRSFHQLIIQVMRVLEVFLDPINKANNSIITQGDSEIEMTLHRLVTR